MYALGSENRAVLTAKHPNLAGAFWHRLAGLPLRLFDTILTWQERVQVRSHLAGLSDHHLKDMGLSRSDALVEASKPFWRL